MVITARTIVCVALLAVRPAGAWAQSDLERARALYNAGQFDESIAVADTAKHRASATASATLIAARALLDRFREQGNSEDLTTARRNLMTLNPRLLALQEIIEWQIGVATALFLENQPGPAADMFSTVLPSARGTLPAAEYDKLIEWWGSALSRVAEAQTTGAARKDAYVA